MKKKRTVKNLLLIAASIMMLASAVQAGEPRILNLTMNPPNPSFGDIVTVDLDLCINEYVNPATLLMAISSHANLVGAPTNGQIFVVHNNGPVGTYWLGTASNDMGYNAGTGPTDWQGPFNCTDCGGNSNSHVVHHTFTFRIPPANMFPGCDVSNFYLHVVGRNYNMDSTNWANANSTCRHSRLNWSLPAPPPEYEIRKRFEGVAQDPGDLVLFSIDYKYGGGPLRIEDVLPAGNYLRFVRAGPGAPFLTLQPAVGATTGTVRWDFPNRAGVPGYAEGTVWILMELNNPAPAIGTNIPNTATASMPGHGSKNSSATMTVGRAALTINKYQNVPTLQEGEIVTYTLEYEINGSRLVAYQSFDNLAPGTIYGTPGNGIPPPGWRFSPDGSGDVGSWEVVDECGTGDNYLRGSASANQRYPGLLLDGPNETFCTGQIVSDVMIEPYSYEGADAQVIIRHNGQTGAASYSVALILSIDNTPGRLAFQLVTGGTPSWPSTFNGIDIVGNKWYRTRIDVIQSGNDYIYRARVWAKGDPEPNTWHIQYTQTGAATNNNWRCDGAYNTWRPGVNEQRGDSAVRDSYDNFMVYQPRTNANAFISDDIPPGVTFAGASAGYASTNPVRWNLGSIANQSGSYTHGGAWWIALFPPIP